PHAAEVLPGEALEHIEILRVQLRVRTTGADPRLDAHEELIVLVAEEARLAGRRVFGRQRQRADRVDVLVVRGPRLVDHVAIAGAALRAGLGVLHRHEDIASARPPPRARTPLARAYASTRRWRRSTRSRATRRLAWPATCQRSPGVDGCTCNSGVPGSSESAAPSSSRTW